MKQDQIIEGLGFLLEVNLFFMAGVLFFTNLFASLLLYIGGLIMAVVVGQLIIKNHEEGK